MAETMTGVPEVEITLDKPRRMRFTIGAIQRIKQATGLGLESLDTLQGPALFDHIDGVLWAVLAGEDPTLTRAEVAEMIHPGNLAVVSEALGRLVGLSMPEVDPLAEKAAKGAKAKRAA